MSRDLIEASFLEAAPAFSESELAERSGLTVTEVHVLWECGALASPDPAGRYTAQALGVARLAQRLREELVLDDPHALAVVLRLRQRIGELEAEIEGLRARLWR